MGMKLSLIRLVGAALLVASFQALGGGIDDYVLLAAQTRQNTAAVVNDRAARVVYVGEHASCSQVAVLWKGTPQQNFQVCQGKIQDKHSVAPLWPADSSSKQLLSMIVEDALRYGQASSVDPNGYRISARGFTDVAGCGNVEVLISYDGDLSDMDVRRVCGLNR